MNLQDFVTGLEMDLSQSYHAIMNIALMDGSVRTISASLSQKTWTDALGPADGQVLGSDW